MLQRHIYYRYVCWSTVQYSYVQTKVENPCVVFVVFHTHASTGTRQTLLVVARRIRGEGLQRYVQYSTYTVQRQYVPQCILFTQLLQKCWKDKDARGGGTESCKGGKKGHLGEVE